MLKPNLIRCEAVRFKRLATITQCALQVQEVPVLGDCGETLNVAFVLDAKAADC